MQLDTSNKIVKLCADGIMLEGHEDEALKLFHQAWNEATNNFEKFVAAHYVARHQKTVGDKLKWDQTALQLALTMNDDSIRGAFPSLYLNIAKDYEDLGDFREARKNYDLAFSFVDRLPDDGYGNMITTGILNGIERVTLRA